MTESTKLGMMYEYLVADHEDVGAMGINTEQFHKFVISAQHYFSNEMFLMLEYGFEYYNADLAGADDDRDASVLAFRTGWAF